MAAPASNEAPGPDRPLPGARTALILLFAINLFNYVDRYILAALEDPISKEFGASKAQMGWLVTAFLLTYMVVSPLFGWLADRMPRWALIGIGVILWSLASGGSGLARTYAILFLMRTLIGVGEGAYGPVAPTLISDLYPVAVRGKVLAWFYAAIPVGSALGYVLGGLFVAGRHWHWAFLLTIPPGVLLGAWCFFMKEPPRGVSDAVKVQRKATLGDYRMLIRIPSYTINCAAMTAMTFAIGGIAFWLPNYLDRERGIDPTTARLASGGIVVVAGLFATILGGLAGDKLRPKYGGSYFLVSGAGMLAGFPLFLAVLLVPFPLAWVFLFLAVFCLFFNTGPSNTALANVSPPAMRATAFALNIFAIHALGDAISPPIMGWIADRWSMSASFGVVSVMFLIGGGLWLWGARFLARDTALAPTRLDEPRGFEVGPAT